LAVVNVTNRADVDVRFVTLKLFLSHLAGRLCFGGPLALARVNIARYLLRWRKKIKPGSGKFGQAWLRKV
ncbi:hypothetical protein, partial [Thioclava sp.]|uniref:hypothetical protein n=1 Tax=Thioclava sp. TaxID=1933450 RepID=UPI003AA8CED2